ncbi:Ig-like domain-containing protein, partial [Maribellus sediminis]|uniref:Ig-like domain-containing protein n=1 Tax=Maribellus sediminis TaxID=2696285 RepID=UPI0014314108
VSDTLPAGLTLVSATPSTGTWTDPDWTVGTLASGETATIDITATVDAGMGDSTLTNTVSHTQDQTDTDATPDIPGVSITVNNEADIVITKTVDNPAPDEGSTVVFTVEITNNGPARVNNLVVSDTLPAGLTFVSATPSAGSWTAPDWTIGTLASGETVTLDITATVDVGTGGTTITNTASHTQDQTDSNETTDDPTESITVNNEADIVINKTVDKVIHVEQDTVIYTVEVTNNGPAQVTNLLVTDNIPAGLTYVSGTTATGTWTNPDWMIGTLASGETATLELKATVDIGTKGIVVNTASHTQDQVDSNLSPDGPRAIIFVPGLASLVTQKTLLSGDTLPAEGEVVRYEIFVVNDGPSQATNVTLTDQLPVGLTATANSGQISQGTYDAGTGLWAIGTLEVGSYATLILEGTVDIGTGGDTITNITTAASAEQPDFPTSGDKLEVTVVVDNTADLITKKILLSGDPTPAEGDVVTYAIEVTNNGTAQATNISLTDQLPVGLTATGNNGQVTKGLYDSGTGLWTIDTLANGETATLTLEGTVDAGTGADTIINITTTATTPDQVDTTDTGDNTEVEVVIDNEADIVITKTVDNPAPDEGSTVVFTVEVTNNGPAQVTNLVVSDTLPAGLTLVSATPSTGTWTDPDWTVGTLASGETATIDITATVDAGTGGTTITNTASNTQDQTDTDETIDDPTESITVNNESDIVITKTVDNPTPDEGSTVIFTVEVTNNGPAQVNNLVVSDTLPSGLTFISATASVGVWTDPDWTIGSLTSGETATLEITAKVDVGTGGSTIVNSATHTQDQTDTDATPDDPTESITVNNEADIVITKVVDNFIPEVGDNIVFTITVENRGAARVTNLVVTDQLPAGLTYVSATPDVGTWDDVTWQWTIGTMDVGEIATMLITANVNGDVVNSVITNTATHTQDQVDSNVSTDDPSERLAVNSLANIITEKLLTSGNPVPAEGDIVSFQINVSNNGPAKATNVTLTDLLPVGLTPTANNGTVSSGIYDQNTGLWSLDTIPVGTTETLYLEGTVDVGTGGETITNVTSTAISDDQFDWTDQGDTLTASVVIDNTADLITVKTLNGGSSTVTEGSVVSYLITVTNNGTAQASNVSLTDLLPTGFTATANNGTASQGSYNATTGLWTVGTLDNGASATLTLEGTVNAGTGGMTITNVTTAAESDQDDPSTSGDDLEETVVVDNRADLQTEKILVSGNPNPEVGDTVRYEIHVTNWGPARATGISLVDKLPNGITPTSFNGTRTQGTYDAQSGLWSIGTLDNLIRAYLLLEGTVDAGTKGDTITNVTTAATGDQPDPNFYEDDLDETIIVAGYDSTNTTVAVEDSFSVDINGELSGDVSENDYDPEGDNQVNYTIIDSALNGTLTMDSTGMFTYVPDSGYSGDDYFVYEVCDDGAPVACDTAMVSITVTNPENTTVAVEDTFTVDMNGELSGDVSENDYDPEGNNQNFTVLDSTLNGTITMDSSGMFVYVPDSGFTGDDSFIYEVCDDGVPMACDTALVNISVVDTTGGGSGSDSLAPIAVNDINLTMMDEPVEGFVLVNDIGRLNDTLSVLPGTITTTESGSVIIHAEGSYKYTPPAGFTGQDFFKYEVCNQNGKCDEALVTLIVIPPDSGVNRRPVAVADNYLGKAGNPVHGNLISNDFDPDGDSISIVPSPMLPPYTGDVTINADGTFEYVPEPNFKGEVTFTYQICDEEVRCDIAVVTIKLVDVYDTLNTTFATDDAVFTQKDVPVSGNLAPNDYDSEGDPQILFTLIEGPFIGDLALNENDGTFTYTPQSGITGDDYFVYAVTDSGVPQAIDYAIAYVVVEEPYAPNTPPVAVNDTFRIDQHEMITGNILANDFDPDGDSLMLDTVPFYTVSGGVLTVEPDGTITYQPEENFTGTDSFAYRICDSGTPSLCDTAVVYLIVNEDSVTNHPPVAVTDSFEVFNSEPVDGNILANDYDPDGDAITLNLTLVTQPEKGTVSIAEDGSIVYTPDGIFTGTDQFTYQICDNGNPSLCDTGIVVFVVKDSDIDGKPDDIDIDDDNDGIVDISEGDGTIDTDGDGLPDSYDIDADNDGITDNIEGQAEGQYRGPTGVDTNGDGLDDEYDPDVGGTLIIPVDTDSDGIPDYLDPDSDNDGVPDNIEGHDANADGYADEVISGSDLDNDGLDDAFDIWELKSNIDGSNAPLQDFDGDGIRDWRDTDDDGDNILTANEDANGDGIFANDDADQDGHPDYLDADMECELFVPDAFSPNGDNIYDYFVIECIEQYPNASLQIYNRWGNIVFEQENYGNEARWGSEDAWWDGRSSHNLTVGNEKLPVGTYIYILDLKDGSEPRTGTVFINY